MIEELLEKIRDYRERASHYFRNFSEERLKNPEKAGEALWGTVSCLINAISILERGEPQQKHGKQRKFAEEFLISRFKEGKELFKIYRDVEKIHSSFYHAFLEEDELENLFRDGIKLIEVLDKTLEEELKTKGL